MKKKQLLVAALLGAVAVSTVALATHKTASFMQAEEDVHKIVLNKDNYLLNAEKEAQTFTRNTNEGNPITFSCFGGASLVETENNFAQARDANGWFVNTTPLNGLYQIKIVCSASRTIRFSYGSEADNLDYSTDNLTGTRNHTITIAEPNVNYVKFEQIDEGNNWIESIEYYYTCSSEVHNRGQLFSGVDGLGIDIDPVSKATGKITVDIKYTTATKVLMTFFDSGWNGAPYQEFAANTESTTGLKVSQLIDGYTRYEFDLANYDKCTVETVSIVHIRKEWTDGEGYVDLSAPNVAELKGSHFTGSSEWFEFYGLDSTDPLHGQMVVDVLFKTSGYLAASIGGISNGAEDAYYGYYNISRNGIEGNPNGVSMTKLGNGYYRFTFSYADMDKGNKLTDNTLDLVQKFVIRNSWGTCKEAYVDIVSF